MAPDSLSTFALLVVLVLFDAEFLWIVIAQGRHLRLVRAWRIESSDRIAAGVPTIHDGRNTSSARTQRAGSPLEDMAMGMGRVYPLTHAGIVVNAPRESGVYAVLRSGTCVYVGESEDIRRRLIEYLNEGGTTRADLRFQFEIAHHSHRRIRQQALVRELRPTDNPLPA